MTTLVDTEFELLRGVEDAMRTQQGELLAQLGPDRESGPSWHDSSPMARVRTEERRVTADLAKLVRFLYLATLVPRQKEYDQVEIGCVVTVRVIQEGHPARVDHIFIAADARLPRIPEVEDIHRDDGLIPVSTDSPIGQALMGARIGETRETRVARHTVKYEVVELA